MQIREAVPADNDQLRDLQARCPQGTRLVVSTVNTPDFFARARAYESYRVYVAEEDGRIVGSIGCALRNGLLNGRVLRVGYGFQSFVSPDHRRRGVATGLHRRREEYLAGEGAVLVYGLVMEGNRASMRLLEGRGYGLHRTLAMPGLAVYREMKAAARGRIRPATPGDLSAVAELLNETWRGFDLYEPTSAEALARFVARTPAYSLDDLLLLEHRGEISACLGMWDRSRIARTTVRSLDVKLRALGLLVDLARLLRPMPPSIRPGHILKQMVLTPIGFRDPGDVAALLRHANNLALGRGIEQLFFVCQRGHPLLETTGGFIRVDTALHLYVKPFQPNAFPGGERLFVDGVDL